MRALTPSEYRFAGFGKGDDVGAAGPRADRAAPRRLAGQGPRHQAPATARAAGEAAEIDRAPNSPSARLPASRHGYVLRIEPDELDAQHFERLLLLARDSIDGGDPATAVPLLTQALDLWRGGALADAAELTAARGEILRLDNLRAMAIEELAD